MTDARILVVDDEKGVLRSCVRILKRRGFDVTGRSDSTAVPDLLRQETFDLLLSDIKMPRLDGLELLRLAKEIDPHLTVVLITGYGTMEDAVRAIRLGAQGFLLKPFEPDELVAAVKNSLAQRALLRDSLRLQTLLPLLEINKMLQISGGEVSLVQQVLEIAGQEIGAARMAWLSLPQPDDSTLAQAHHLTEAAVVQHQPQPASLPSPAIDRALESGQPVWVLADGTLVNDSAGHPNIVGALLPLLVKGRIVGLLTAQAAGSSTQVNPFGQLGLELLAMLGGQLAIIIENVQLFQQAEKLRTLKEDIIQNMTNGLIAVDNNSRVSVFNPAASTMLGRQATEVLNRPLTQAMPEAEPLTAIFDNTLITGKPHPRQEITITRQDGRTLPISISAAPLAAGANGRSSESGVVGVMEDLREIKALEAEHRRLDRLAALGEMAAIVAHEIRNPIAGIAAGVDYLTRQAKPGSIEAEGSAMIQGEIKRVNRILEDILFVARPLQLELVCQPLEPIIQTVLQRCQTQIRAKEIGVTTRYSPDLPLLLVDNQRLEQVLANLVTNAAQALAPGGQLTIEAQPDSMQPDFVEIQVADTGPGISPDIRQRIFDPFFTTKTKGTGLGLSVAHRIIEEHRGSIQVESSPEQGTRFIIKLPVEKRNAS